MACRLLARLSASTPIFTPTLLPPKIQKSELAIGEPRRHRVKARLKFVSSQLFLSVGEAPPKHTVCDSRNRARWDAFTAGHFFNLQCLNLSSA
jgi:hypothetical protein